MLAGLRRLCALPRHGVPMSTYRIAAACNCSPEQVRLIERSALRKVRNRLPPEMREAFAELLAKDRTTAFPKPTSNA